MIGKRAIVAAAGSVLMLAVTSGLALAHGFGGRGEGGHEMFLLLRAAGVTHSQISSAFHNDANLKTDRTNLKSAHEALMSCLVSGKDCTSQITAFANAQQAMTQERLTVLGGLCKNAPNSSQAASIYSQLQQLQAQKKQIFHSVFGSPDTEGSPEGSTNSPNG
jgi:hypothetical protein